MTRLALALGLAALVTTSSLATSEVLEAHARATNAPTTGDDDPRRQFDFWLGSWTVYDATSGEPAGTNEIHFVSDGEVMIEEWRNTQGQRGTSMSWFGALDRRWHQIWVTLHENAAESIGGWEDDRLVLRSEKDGVPTGRCAWIPFEDGTVRQHWETTADGGLTWTTAADLIYERREQDGSGPDERQPEASDRK